MTDGGRGKEGTSEGEFAPSEGKEGIRPETDADSMSGRIDSKDIGLGKSGQGVDD